MRKLTFKIELEESTSRGVDSFSRGHITVEGDDEIISSKGKNPDQSMMIFLSVVHLLDGISNLMDKTINSEFEFIGVDSSFQFFVKKEVESFIIIDSKKRSLGVIKIKDFADSLWQAIEKFVAYYTEVLDREEAIYEDLISSIQQFKQKFNL